MKLQKKSVNPTFVQKTTYNENWFTLDDLTYNVTWLSKDCIIATNTDSNGNTSHDLLVREDNGQPIISKIADYYITK